jgi:Tfp pilus assembly protein PilF
MSLWAVFVGPRRAAVWLIRRADRARDAGHHAEAAELYSQALDLTPARTDIRVQFGNMLKEVGKHQAAEAAHRRALSQSPEDADIHLQLGHLFKQTGRKERAIAAYRDALRFSADRTVAAAELIAFEAEESAPKRLPQDELHRLVGEGDRFRDARDHTRAAEAYGAAVALAPARIDIRVQHGNLLKDPGRLQEAEVVYRSALAKAPDEAAIHLQLGHSLKLRGRRAAALECYRIAGRGRFGTVYARPATRAVRRGRARRTGTAVRGAAASRRRHSSPEFRQAVDYDTLLGTNPFGDTFAVEYSTYAGLAERLATSSIAAARNSLLLNPAHQGLVGHLPFALVARDGEGTTNLEHVVKAQEQAVRAHIAAASFGSRLAISCDQARLPRLTVRWRPSVADAPIAVIIPTRDRGQDLLTAIEHKSTLAHADSSISAAASASSVPV